MNCLDSCGAMLGMAQVFIFGRTIGWAINLFAFPFGEEVVFSGLCVILSFIISFSFWCPLIGRVAVDLMSLFYLFSLVYYFWEEGCMNLEP